MSDDTVTAAEGLFLAPPARNYSPWYQWMSRLAAITHEDPLPEGDPEAIPGWLEGRRQRLAELLGPQPQPVVPLNTETLESTQCDGYRRNKIVFDTEDTMSVPAYLLVPDDRDGAPPGPAVLACHGHGPGKSQAVGLEHTDMPNADYALQLARRGYVVLAPDLRCFGERQDWNPEDHYACDTNLVHAAMAGWNPLAQNVWDLCRCLDLLQEHPLVDPTRLGMVGISYGGTVTLFTAAVDQRVTAAVVSGYFSSWAESHKMPWNMCGSQIMFGMLGKLEHEDLGALIAPRARCSSRPAPRTTCSRWPPPPSPCDAPGSSTTPSEPAIAWSMTSSRGSTNGTAPRPCPSSTAGSATPRPPPPTDRAEATGCAYSSSRSGTARASAALRST